MQPSLPIFVPALFITLTLLLEFGRRLGARRQLSEKEEGGLGAINGAIYGLMGLILAFTFSGAADRFDTRRAQITEEANAIGTLYYRVDLLPEAAQPKVREDMREYLDARLAFYRDFGDSNADAHLTHGHELQKRTWDDVVKALGNPSAGGSDTATRMLVITALNQAIDVEGVRELARVSHPPIIIYYLLIVLVMVGSFLAGHEMGVKSSQSWLHVIAYALVLTVVMYIIADLEYPRGGLIRIEAFDQVLYELRQSMN